MFKITTVITHMTVIDIIAIISIRGSNGTMRDYGQAVVLNHKGLRAELAALCPKLCRLVAAFAFLDQTRQHAKRIA